MKTTILQTEQYLHSQNLYISISINLKVEAQMQEWHLMQQHGKAWKFIGLFIYLVWI